MNIMKKYWHLFLAGSIFIVEALVFLILRKNIYVGILDNLDLFITQLKMLRDNDAFFVHGQMMPILQSIDRNYFPSEFSLYNILFFLLPDLYAYIVGYLLKLLVAFFSCILLAKLILQDKYAEYNKIVTLVSVAFALLPLYPMYAICFASMPFALYLFIRLYREAKWWLYVLLFFYPIVSYFTFFGAFILGYVLIATIILAIRDKKIPWRILGGFMALMAGFVCFEYRLFSIMLFSDVVTIRETMVTASLGLDGLLGSFWEAFRYGVIHAQPVHAYFVLPLCAIYFIWNNANHIRKHQVNRMIRDPFNLTILFIVFNCVVYALYFWEPLRSMVETVLPPLKGFQYNRTVYFNTFAWYFAFFFVLKAVYQKKEAVAYLCGLVAILIIGGRQTEFSDFYNTVYCNLYKAVKHTQTNQLSYGEFYGEELMESIKADIDYKPEQGACAYGFHPAVLSYNGISTIDGYCGYYSQEYKEDFREVIEPTLERNENWREYYDDWACRAYLFSASGVNTYNFGENADSSPQEILINTNALKNLGCDYIFSRTEISNAEEMSLTFVKEYHMEEIPYSVYLYRL
ncbi:MAG: hypothetical protein K2L82_13480 [Lachnospiraceae bacterium]|nr:hypothetical protein [Lachnospiraceae bacterium]